jgi:hypothetical protein
MVIFILIIIIIALLLFIYNSQKQSIQVSKEGGMRNKYSLLINFILEGDPRVRVIRETATSIDLGMVSAGGATSFFLTQTFGNITVQWKMRSPIFGEHEMEWEFHEYLNQEKMIEKINIDLEKYQKNVMKSNGYE